MILNINGNEIPINQEKEWKLIHSLTFDGTCDSYDIDVAECSELFFEVKGLVNENETTASNLRIVIFDKNNNSIEFSKLNSQKNSSPNVNQYERLLASYNRLYWEAFSSQYCLNDTYTSLFTNPMIPYAVKKDVGKCVKLNLYTVANYTLISGSINIYGR